MSIITLLTDFGTRDEYVGVVKGVILSINPQATIVDISHQVAPQAILQAADLLQAAYGWFPQGTVHLAVVDPGVGSERAIIAARYKGYTFLGPDNGLLAALWQADPPRDIVRVENSRYFLHPVSTTFHGRDIFAPVAAHLSLGIDPASLGAAVAASDLVTLPVAKAVWNRDLDQVEGKVTGVDRFGNLLTNIDASLIDAFESRHRGLRLVVQIEGERIQGIASTYAQCAKGALTALIGSRNRLEIAVNGGSAVERFASAIGLAVRLEAAP